MNARVLMCSSSARASARLHACSHGSVRVLTWLCARAGVVGLYACQCSSARVRAWLYASAGAALHARLRHSRPAAHAYCDRPGPATARSSSWKPDCLPPPHPLFVPLLLSLSPFPLPPSSPSPPLLDLATGSGLPVRPAKRQLALFGRHSPLPPRGLP
jgi:hypothetical protein